MKDDLRPSADGSRPDGKRAFSASVEWLARGGGPSLELLVDRPTSPTRSAPLLFLHGAFVGAWCWEEYWLPRAAATGRHVAALSLRGHGGSEGREAVAWAGLADFFADPLLAIRAMPGAACERIAGAGHFPMLGDRSAVGSDLLCRWLDCQGLGRRPSLGLRAVVHAMERLCASPAHGPVPVKMVRGR